MKLIIISSSETVKNDHNFFSDVTPDHKKEEPYYVTKMFEEGLKTFHFRKTAFSSSDVKNYMQKIPVKYHNRIVFHTHHSFVSQYNGMGVNLNKKDKKNELKTWIKLRILKANNPKLTISTSYRKVGVLLEEEKSKFDYVFLSPIYDNLTGNFYSGLEPNTLKKLLTKVPHKVIARGGVSVDKVQQAYELGFEGIAAHSLIWKKKDPFSEFMLFKEKFKELGIPLE